MESSIGGAFYFFVVIRSVLKELDKVLTKHPWTLHGIFRLSTSQDIAVILEWRPACVVPCTVTVGNVVPVASSSTPALFS